MSAGRALEYFLCIWLIATAAIVGYRLMTGRISLHGLLFNRHGEFSPGRVQLLLFTLAGALGYLGTALAHGADKIPDIPTALLYLGGGSHLVYLGAKHLRGGTRR